MPVWPSAYQARFGGVALSGLDDSQAVKPLAILLLVIEAIVRDLLKAVAFVSLVLVLANLRHNLFHNEELQR